MVIYYWRHYKMGPRKIKRQNNLRENLFDMLFDISQLAFGIIFSVYGLFNNNSIAIGIGGLLLLFGRRRLDISFPFKDKK